MFTAIINAGIDFRRKNLTSMDIIFWRLKLVLELKGLSLFESVFSSGLNPLTAGPEYIEVFLFYINPLSITFWPY